MPFTKVNMQINGKREIIPITDLYVKSNEIPEPKGFYDDYLKAIIQGYERGGYENRYHKETVYNNFIKHLKCLYFWNLETSLLQTSLL